MTHRHRLRILALSSMVVLTLLTSNLGRADAHAERYVVRQDDTLSEIALAYGTTIHALMVTNNLSRAEAIRVGQVLLIQSDTVARRSPRYQHDREESVVGPGSATRAAYVVRSGDTLSAIAVRFGISVPTLIAANPGAVHSPLRVGQRLSVPAQASAAQPSPVNQGSGPATVAAPVPSQVGQAGTIEALLTAQAQAAGVGVGVALVKAVAWQESGWRMVIAADGGIGVMQLMPDTVAWINTSVLGMRIDPYTASDNIRGGVALLRYYLSLFGGNQQLAIAAYHQGLGSVQARGISASTAGYVANVLALEQRFTT